MKGQITLFVLLLLMSCGKSSKGKTFNSPIADLPGIVVPDDSIVSDSEPSLPGTLPQENPATEQNNNETPVVINPAPVNGGVTPPVVVDPVVVTGPETTNPETPETEIPTEDIPSDLENDYHQGQELYREQCAGNKKDQVVALNGREYVIYKSGKEYLIKETLYNVVQPGTYKNFNQACRALTLDELALKYIEVVNLKPQDFEFILDFDKNQSAKDYIQETFCQRANQNSGSEKSKKLCK